MNSNVAALLGNGLSIAHNSSLTLGSIYQSVAERINDEAASSGAEPMRFLQAVASNIASGDSSKDFEALFGPFGQIRDSLKFMGALARHTGDMRLSESITNVTQYSEAIRRNGVGHVLEVIASESAASWYGPQVVPKFMAALVAATHGGRLTIGNLNYDSLVMAAITSDHPHISCDMTDGREAAHVLDLGNGVLLNGRPLRTTDDFPFDRRVRLLHLHGSLCWLRDPNTGRVWRFDAAGMRHANYWSAYREGQVSWTPEVVLTNQRTKSTEVGRAPFKLGYDEFFRQLVLADRWLVAGYSFRDECVNELLARAWRARPTPPVIVVLTHGDGLKQHDVLRAVDWQPHLVPEPGKFVFLERSGIGPALQGSLWQAFAALPTLQRVG